MNVSPLANTLLEHQLNYFGYLFRQRDDHICRKLIFQSTSSELVQMKFKRKRGRPRMNWAEELKKHALTLADGEQNFQELAMHKNNWKNAVHKYCRNSNLTI